MTKDSELTAYGFDEEEIDILLAAESGTLVPDSKSKAMIGKLYASTQSTPLRKAVAKPAVHQDCRGGAG
ncbi:hypothetical protein AGMMS49938_06650 [Fibrobacterales bacterium]|nr:hypothetical protein AGMMS49938_06650 [Fibrobacterales bacterium]